MPPIPVNTPDGLRQMRDMIGVSQQKLADRIGVHVTTIKNWEQGKSRISVDGIQRCQRLLREWNEEHAYQSALAQKRLLLDSRKEKKRSAQARKALLAEQRAALQAYRHEGDRRPAPIRHSHASTPSLDELFS